MVALIDRLGGSLAPVMMDTLLSADTRISIDFVAFTFGLFEIWGSSDRPFPVLPVNVGPVDTLVIREGALQASF